MELVAKTTGGSLESFFLLNPIVESRQFQYRDNRSVVLT